MSELLSSSCGQPSHDIFQFACAATLLGLTAYHVHFTEDLVFRVAGVRNFYGIRITSFLSLRPHIWTSSHYHRVACYELPGCDIILVVVSNRGSIYLIDLIDFPALLRFWLVVLGAKVMLQEDVCSSSFRSCFWLARPLCL